jgi:transcription-repair coupling factor (superfamily II helicase)
VSIDTLKEQLRTLGYSRCDTVYTKGSYACRGGIIDVFLFGEQKPIRIEFFDNTVESIHYFNLQTQVVEERISDFSLGTGTPSPATQRPVVAPKPKKAKQTTQKEALEERPSNGSSNQLIKFLLIAILFVLLLLLLKY